MVYGLTQNNITIYQNHFEETYDYPPSKMSSFAYDLVSAIIAIAATQDDSEIMREKILNPLGFSGTTGIFRFKDGGIVERMLDIYEVNKGELHTVSPASFQFSVIEENMMDSQSQ